MMNLRLAFRQLLRSPGFTLLAVMTLGLGIGANTAMFSVLNGILFKPLPYPDSAQLDRIDRATPQDPDGNISPADFLDLKHAEHGYANLAAYDLGDASLSEPGQPAEIGARREDDRQPPGPARQNSEVSRKGAKARSFFASRGGRSSAGFAV